MIGGGAPCSSLRARAAALAALVASVVLVAEPARAGEPHARVYAARIVGAAIVPRVEFPDRLARIELGRRGTDGVTIKVAARACRITLRVASDYAPLGGAPLAIFASPAACAALRRDAAVEVQVYGLADMFQIVSLRRAPTPAGDGGGADDGWRALPLMRLTVSPFFARCLRGDPGVGVHLACGAIARGPPL